MHRISRVPVLLGLFLLAGPSVEAQSLPVTPGDSSTEARPSHRPPGTLPGFAPGPGAQPDELPHPQWNPRFRKAGFWDALVISTGSILYVAESQVELGGGGASWTGPILWDRAVRDALRFDVASGRNTAGSVSDLMMIGSLVHNALFDNLLIAWVVHGEPELAWQMSVMNAEAYAIALSLTGVVKAVSSRARPMVDDCEADPLYSPDCQSLDRYRSFFSGHSAVTAVGAGLLCAHHLNLPLYDGGLLDVGTCVMGIGLTLATGAMRIASDNHWATDVTTGHLVGFASGFLVPMLLYYNATDDEDVETAGAGHREGTGRMLVLPSFGADYVGVQAVGRLL